MSLSPEDLQRIMDEQSRIPGIVAHLDQQQAALDTNRNIGLWCAALLLLCAEKGSEAAKLMALHQMRKFLVSRPEEEIMALTAFLFTDILVRISESEHGGDLMAAIARVAGDNFSNFEKFAATDGASCHVCGADEGWGDHDCDDTEHVEE